MDAAAKLKSMSAKEKNGQVQISKASSAAVAVLGPVGVATS